MIERIDYGHDCWGASEAYYDTVDIPSGMTIEQQEEFAEELRRRYPESRFVVRDLEKERQAKKEKEELELRNRELKELARLKAKYE